MNRNFWLTSLSSLFLGLAAHAAVHQPIFPTQQQSASGSNSFDFDLVIVGCGVGGHAAALHAVSFGLKTAVITGGDIGGTCVNRGCVPSKALLAVAGQAHSLSDVDRLAKLGIRVQGHIQFHRETAANHAADLVANVRKDLEKSIKSHGVEVIHEQGIIEAPQVVRVGKTRIVTGRNIIVAPGSVPAVPPGITVDEDRIFTSDSAVLLRRVPEWIAIVGSGYIGLEFADIFSSLGSEVTLIDAAEEMLPSFDRDIARQAERLILKPRSIDTRPGVVISDMQPGVEGHRPVVLKLRDVKSGMEAGSVEVDAVMIATGRRSNAETLGLEAVGVQLLRGAFVPVDDRMRVLTAPGGSVVPHLYCIGDANGKLMLAHAASAQGVSAVENILGRVHVVNHRQIPAACFTHPEIGFVGSSEDEAKQLAEEGHFELGKVTSHFRANSKALAEVESGGLLKLLFNKQSGEVLGAHIIGAHASDLIQQVANAMAGNMTVHQLSFAIHSHPTLSEVMLNSYKLASGLFPH